MGDLAVPPKVIDKTPMAKGDQSDISGRFALPTMSAEGPTSPTEHREGAVAPPCDHMSEAVMEELVKRCSRNVSKSIQKNLDCGKLSIWTLMSRIQHNSLIEYI